MINAALLVIAYVCVAKKKAEEKEAVKAGAASCLIGCSPLLTTHLSLAARCSLLLTPHSSILNPHFCSHLLTAHVAHCVLLTAAWTRGRGEASHLLLAAGGELACLSLADGGGGVLIAVISHDACLLCYRFG